MINDDIFYYIESEEKRLEEKEWLEGSSEDEEDQENKGEDEEE
jgi:hypothetical protein